MATPSPDGTKGKTVVDKDGKTWTLGAAQGPEFALLRDGVHAAGGGGVEYKVQQGLYVRQSTGKWWLWDGAAWKAVVGEPTSATPPSTPAPAPTPAPAGAFDARAYARTFSKDAIDALVFIVNSNKTSVSDARVRAARTLLELDRGLLGEVQVKLDKSLTIS